MVYAFIFLIGMLAGVVAVILRLNIQGNLAIHYIEGEDKPYMCLELDKDVDNIARHKIIVLRVCIRDHRDTQK